MSGRRGGVWEEGWCRGGGVVSGRRGRRGGVGEEGWCRGGGVRSGRRGGVGEEGWCRGGGVRSGGGVCFQSWLRSLFNPDG